MIKKVEEAKKLYYHMKMIQCYISERMKVQIHLKDHIL